MPRRKSPAKLSKNSIKTFLDNILQFQDEFLTQWTKNKVFRSTKAGMKYKKQPIYLPPSLCYQFFEYVNEKDYEIDHLYLYFIFLNEDAERVIIHEDKYGEDMFELLKLRCKKVKHFIGYSSYEGASCTYENSPAFKEWLQNVAPNLVEFEIHNLANESMIEILANNASNLESLRIASFKLDMRKIIEYISGSNDNQGCRKLKKLKFKLGADRTNFENRIVPQSINNLLDLETLNLRDYDFKTVSKPLEKITKLQIRNNIFFNLFPNLQKLKMIFEFDGQIGFSDAQAEKSYEKLCCDLKNCPNLEKLCIQNFTLAAHLKFQFLTDYIINFGNNLRHLEIEVADSDLVLILNNCMNLTFLDTSCFSKISSEALCFKFNETKLTYLSLNSRDKISNVYNEELLSELLNRSPHLENLKLLIKDGSENVILPSIKKHGFSKLNTLRLKLGKTFTVHTCFKILSLNNPLHDLRISATLKKSDTIYLHFYIREQNLNLNAHFKS